MRDLAVSTVERSISDSGEDDPVGHVSHADIIEQMFDSVTWQRWRKTPACVGGFLDR